MTKHTTLPAFTPVPRRIERHDGWTPERQHAFIEALASTGSVASACKAVGKSTHGAYHLRRQPGADSFREAWEAALDLGVQRIEDVAMDRALNGVEVPVYSYGKLVGSRTHYNDRLLMFMLRNRAGDRFTEGRAKSLNAMDHTVLEREKKKWRKEWELEQQANKRRDVSPEDIRASIDRKVEAIRRNVVRQREEEWKTLSADTRAAWERYVELRERDFARMNADAEKRRRLAEGPRVTINATPPPAEEPPAPKKPKTRRSLKDDGWD